MGLFDRFKKRFKKSSEQEITADEDSAEAKQASEEGARMRQDIVKTREAQITPITTEEVGDEWDEEDSTVPDPFATPPRDRKERKKAQRAASLEQAEKPEEPKQGKTVPDPMQSTTGRKLVPSGPVKIEVDFGDSATKTGGRVITASSKLDSILE